LSTTENTKHTDPGRSQLKSGKTSAGRFGKISGRMKPIRWSAHARKKTDKREISKAEVEQTIMQPDSTMRSQPPRQIFMRRYLDEVLQTEIRDSRGDRRGNGRSHALQDIEVQEI